LRFLLVDGVCSLFYAGLYVLPGFFLHDQLEQMVAFFKRLGVFTFLLLLVLLGGYFSHEFVKRRRLKAPKSIQSGPTPEETNL
jgi:membrane protein DedA with SNARE-associated domain